MHMLFENVGRKTRTAGRTTMLLALGGALLGGCGGVSADVTGSAGGVDFDRTTQVYFGGPFIIVSMADVECDELDFVRRNYEVGSAPTEKETALLQFSYDEDVMAEGPAPVDISASVSASVLKISGGAFFETIAEGGLLTLDTYEDEQAASGSFEGLLFEDGTLDGTFDATWCRNLKAR
jgi:hypothetical protein